VSVLVLVWESVEDMVLEAVVVQLPVMLEETLSVIDDDLVGLPLPLWLLDTEAELEAVVLRVWETVDCVAVSVGEAEVVWLPENVGEKLLLKLELCVALPVPVGLHEVLQEDVLVPEAVTDLVPEKVPVEEHDQETETESVEEGLVVLLRLVDNDRVRLKLSDGVPVCEVLAV